MLLFHDKELGDIAVTANARSRRFVFRCKDGMLTCTSPIPFREKEMQRAVNELRPKLKALIEKSKQKAQQTRYTPETRIEAEDFRLRFEQKDVSYVRAEMNGNCIVCYYQSAELLADDDVQAWITKTLTTFAQKRVKERLVPRLHSMATERGIEVRGVKVTSAKGRWGSCSTKGSINLSIYLILLPHHLQDYVLQHELTHRIEMNHSPRFWARLDEVCGGKAKALRREMRNYNTSFLIQF